MATAPFLCCDYRLTVDGGWVISDPDRVDELGFPSFVGQAEVPLIFLLLIGRLVVGFLAWVRLIYLLFWALIFIMVSSISRLRLVVWMVGCGGISKLFLRPGSTG